MALPNTGEIVARRIQDGKWVRVAWESGVISQVQSPLPNANADADPGAGANADARIERDGGVWIAPGLLDLQVNGFAGVDFQQDVGDPTGLATAARRLRSTGCTRFFPTLITDDWNRMLRRLERLRVCADDDPVLRRAIAGWHVEGPFLSPEVGYRGAHPGELMLDPAPNHLRAIRRAAGADRVLLTLAPERRGAIEAIRAGVDLGFRISLGHTNASADRIAAAIEAGATGFTHLGNGCPQQLDRHDNIMWRVLERRELRIGLIPDRVHVSDALLRLIHRLHPLEHVYYTTDAMAAADAPPGSYSLGRLQLEVGDDQVVHLPGTKNFAGSALRPIDAIRRAAIVLRRSWRDVWPHFSGVPGDWMGVVMDIAPGRPADFCVIKTNSSGGVDAVDVPSDAPRVG